MSGARRPGVVVAGCLAGWLACAAPTPASAAGPPGGERGVLRLRAFERWIGEQDTRRASGTGAAGRVLEVGPDAVPSMLRTPPTRGSEGVAPAGRPWPTASPAPRTLVEAAARPYDLPVRLNDLVLRYLAYFLGPGRASYARWLARSGRYARIIDEELRLRGMPADLFYLAMIESGFVSTARSHAGAVGLWQFVPRTGRAYGLRVDRWIDERQDPLRCTTAALSHLEDLHQHYGSWELALAAYNGGIGWVDRAVRRYDTNDLWVLARYDFLPRGMFHYVAKIMAAMIVGHNLAALGFGDPPRDPAPPLVSLPAPPGLRLDALARSLPVSEDELASLNPWLLRRRVPAEGGAVRLVVPVATRVETERLLALAAPDPGLASVWHTVLLGDSLRSLARAYGVAATRLAALNELAEDEELLPGRRLIIPLATRRGLDPRRRGPELPLAVLPEVDFPAPDRKLAFFHVPRQGADPRLLAETCGVTVAELALWNDIDPSADLYPGMVVRLYLPAAGPKPKARLLRPEQVRQVAAASPELRAELARRQPSWKPRRRSRRWRYHRVKAGETLESIAARYDLDPERIARPNGLLATELQAGRVLRVPRPRRSKRRRPGRRRRR